jgi:hypothetical protein
MVNCNCAINTITTVNLRCNGGCINNTSLYKLGIERQILNQTSMSGSQFTHDYAAKIVSKNILQNKEAINNSKFWGSKNNLRSQSDRALPSKNPTYINIPTRGNSTKTSITSNKPGGMDSGGAGVDVKHGSYHRYLAKKKGIILSKSLNCSSFCN